MLHYVEKIVHLNGKVAHRHASMRTAEAMRYQQSVALLREQNASTTSKPL
jgi:hypothetical protein